MTKNINSKLRLRKKVLTFTPVDHVDSERFPVSSCSNFSALIFSLFSLIKFTLGVAELEFTYFIQILTNRKSELASLPIGPFELASLNFCPPPYDLNERTNQCKIGN